MLLDIAVGALGVLLNHHAAYHHPLNPLSPLGGIFRCTLKWFCVWTHVYFVCLQVVQQNVMFRRNGTRKRMKICRKIFVIW